MQSDPSSSSSSRGTSLATRTANISLAQDNQLRGGGHQWKWPLTTVEQARAYLSSAGAADILITHTFSATLITELHARGEVAITVDKRDAEHDLPHFKGDFKLIISLKKWKFISASGRHAINIFEAT